MSRLTRERGRLDSDPRQAKQFSFAQTSAKEPMHEPVGKRGLIVGGLIVAALVVLVVLMTTGEAKGATLDAVAPPAASQP